MNIFAKQEKSKISRHHEPSTHLISHPEYCHTVTGLFSGFSISNCFGGCKEEVGWKKLDLVHPHR